MKKNIITYHEKINVIEDFISKDTADFIVGIFNKYLSPTPHNQYIYGGPSAYGCTPLEPVADYTDNPEYNVGVDLLNSIGVAMTKTVSDFYKEPFVVKTIFYSAMIPGASNKLHMDNHYINEENELKIRKNEYNDRAALLYLNEDYSGGELNFPNQEFTIKPSKGTLVFFEGDYTIPHEVTVVESGVRNNLILFLYHEKDSDKPRNRPMYEQEIQLTYDMVSKPEIANAIPKP